MSVNRTRQMVSGVFAQQFRLGKVRLRQAWKNAESTCAAMLSSAVLCSNWHL